MSSTTTTTTTITTPPPRSPTRSTDDIIDTTPFLSSSSSREDSTNSQTRRSARRQQSLREAARFLRRASSRRMMREPSMLVRESAAEQLEERQSDWAYSKPVVILDIVWNLAFVAVASAVLVLSRKENPNMPLRMWVVGYGLQCVLHMVCVCLEYKRRRRRRRVEERIGSGGSLSPGSRADSSEEQYVSLPQFEEEGTRYKFDDFFVVVILIGFILGVFFVIVLLYIYGSQ